MQQPESTRAIIRSQYDAVLLDMDEAQDAMRKAAAATYRPPAHRAPRPLANDDRQASEHS